MRPLRALSACVLLAGACIAGSCATNPTVEPPPKPIPACTDSIMLLVSFVEADTIPTFTWMPECKIGRLIVEEIVEERWGTETLEHTNEWAPPIVYGIHPPGSENVEPAAPLYIGTTYRVSAYRWIDPADPEGFQLIGELEFTP